MGCGRTAPLGSSTSRSPRVERQPIRPVAAQLEKIVEVCEAALLQILDQLRKQIVRWQRSDRDQTILDPEFVIRKIVALVNGLPSKSAALEYALTYENYDTAMRELERHKLDSRGNRRQDKGTLYL